MNQYKAKAPILIWVIDQIKLSATNTPTRFRRTHHWPYSVVVVVIAVVAVAIFIRIVWIKIVVYGGMPS